MNENDDTDETPAADDGAELDPSAAAALLEQTKRQAQRQFSRNPPLVTLVSAALILLGYGAVWWSVRGQHPYKGPSGAALAELYGAVIIVIVLSVRVLRRATSGVSGRSRTQEKALAVAFGTAWIADWVFQGALHYDGASNAIVYGIYPAAAPLVIVGACLAGMAAAQEDRRKLSIAIAVVALATGSAFAGPAGVWGVMAVGGCVIGIGAAAVQIWQRHA